MAKVWEKINLHSQGTGTRYMLIQGWLLKLRDVGTL